MKFIRLSTLMAVSAATLAGAALFLTSQKVQRDEARLEDLKATVTREEAHIRVLRAEWDYLNRPDRLERLVKTQMGMGVPQAKQVSGYIDDVPEPLFIAPPQRKPQFKPQPVALKPVGDPYGDKLREKAAAVRAAKEKARAEKSDGAGPQAVAPSHKPQTMEDYAPEAKQDQFENLLNSLAPASGDADGQTAKTGGVR